MGCARRLNGQALSVLRFGAFACQKPDREGGRRAAASPPSRSGF